MTKANFKCLSKTFRQIKWCLNSGRRDLLDELDLQNHFICMYHFSQSDYQFDSESSKIILKKDAVPKFVSHKEKHGMNKENLNDNNDQQMESNHTKSTSGFVCSYKDCHNSSTKDSSILFFEFPAEGTM